MPRCPDPGVVGGDDGDGIGIAGARKAGCSFVSRLYAYGLNGKE